MHSGDTISNRMAESTQNSYIENGKVLLNIKELNQFQISCLAAIRRGEDALIVQPTGSGKSLCFTLPALLPPGKISLVIEPVFAVIVNQVKALQSKGIDAVALGRTAGTSKSANFRWVLRSLTGVLIIDCTLFSVLLT